MYNYTDFDHDFVRSRIDQFRGQVMRRVDGSLSEDEFKPLRLMNGLYLQLHAYMLRVAIPYGTLNGRQMRQLAYIADRWDRGYGHFTTRQNIQFNWPKLRDVPEILDALGVSGITTGAVCVYHDMLSAAKNIIKDTNIHLAAVSTGFPAGLSPLPLRLQEIQYSVDSGANEIDIVISRRHVLDGNWEALYEEVKLFREKCGDAHMKTILATGELGNLTNIAKASQICMMAGADFIKTSTGKEPTNATLPVSLVMTRMIRDFYTETGIKIGFKAAGGISDTKTALLYMTMIREELGRRWLEPDLFRFGASSLLGDIERQLDHFSSGFYSAPYRHPIA